MWSHSSFSLANLLAILKGKGEAYQQASIQRFLQILTLTNVVANDGRLEAGVVGTLAMFVFIGILLTVGRRNQQQARRWRIGIISITVGLVVYLCSLLGMYLFTFSPVEAEFLYSWPRYVSTYLIMMTGFVIVEADQLSKARSWKPAAVCLLVLLILSDPASIRLSTIDANAQGKRRENTLAQYRIPAGTAELLDPQTDKVFLIATQEDGYAFFLNAYHLAPVHVQYGVGEWWLNDQSEPSDSAEQWVDVLIKDGYTHVYCLRESFEPRFGERFEGPSLIRKGALYRIRHTQNGIVLEEAEAPSDE